MKIVLVTWFDAYSKEEWHTKTELEALKADQPGGQVTITPALLYEQTDEALYLLQSLSPETDQTEALYAGILVIPKGMVKSMEVWKEIE